MTEIVRRTDEVRGLSELAFRELRDAVGGIGSVHRSIADRAFGLSGPGATPARVAHDAISDGVYGALRGVTTTIGRAAGSALSLRDVGDGRQLSSSGAGSAVLGALNGLIGDTLEAEGSDLHTAMSLRVDRSVVEPGRDSLASAYPHATPRLAVFLHGLMETELSWRLGAGPDGETYGTRLTRDLGATAVDVRYNTGRHISENGRSLGELLEAVCAEWPVPVEQIDLIGHSMGGLVARSACHYASLDGAEWVPLVRHVVSLGSPHMGAPLARAVHAAGVSLHRLPEVRPLASLLRRSSAGIKDLRHGSLVDEDWRDRDPHSLRREAVSEVPLLEGATHCFVAATLTGDPRHPVGRLVGDLLVLEDSASGRSRDRRIPFRAEHGMHVGRTHHMALLNHPVVYDRMVEWLAG